MVIICSILKPWTWLTKCKDQRQILKTFFSSQRNCFVEMTANWQNFGLKSGERHRLSSSNVDTKIPESYTFVLIWATTATGMSWKALNHSKYCGKKGTIKYYYLSIADKIQQWCGNENMCKKMMALWTGPYPAQHEADKFTKHGILPCRCDKLKR